MRKCVAFPSLQPSKDNQHQKTASSNNYTVYTELILFYILMCEKLELIRKALQKIYCFSIPGVMSVLMKLRQPFEWETYKMHLQLSRAAKLPLPLLTQT